MSYKKRIKKIGKVLLYILGSVLLLLCLFIGFINLPVGKRIVRDKVQDFLQKKLQSKVEIGSIDYSLPKWITINNIYVEDQHKDTLLFGEKIAVDISMFKLISGNTDIQKVLLKNIVAKINRAQNDSSFNFQFIVDAFAGNKPANKVDKDTAALKITLDRLLLDHVTLQFRDKNAGNDFDAAITNLDVSLSKFQPDRLNFKVKDLTASGVNFFMNAYKGNTTDTAKVESGTAPSPYSLFVTANNFNIRDVNVKTTNKSSGLLYSNNVTHLQLKDVLFDLAKTTASAGKLLLDSSAIQFNMPKTDSVIVKDSTTATATMPWKINVKELALKNNHIKFDNTILAKTEGLDFNHLNIAALSANIADLHYSVNKTAALVTQLHFKDTSGFALDTVHVNFLMTDSILSAKELYVKTPQTLIQNFLELKFDSLAGITTNPRNSSLNAIFKNTSIAFNDLYMLVPALKKSLPPEQFANNLLNLNTELRGSLAQLYLPYFRLTGFTGSSVTARGTVYNLTDAEKLAYDIYIDQSNFLKADLLKFIPKEKQASLEQLPAIINLSGHFTGNKNNLTADLLTSGKGFLVNGRFNLQNISDPAKLKYDLAVRNISADKSFILGLIPEGKLPPDINLPEKISMAGTLKGNTKNFVADLKLNDSYGAMTVKGYINNATDPKMANYNILFTTNKYAIGKLLRRDTILGTVTGRFTAKGKGLDYKTMRSTITASVKQLEYNKYNYQNANVFAVLNAGMIDSKGSINDNSVKLNYDIKANVQNEYPTLKGFIRVDTVQLQKLNLNTDTLNFSLTANIDANNLRPRNLDLKTIIDSIRMQLGNQSVNIDSLSLIGTSADGKDSINFKAPFANLYAAGAFDYDKVGNALANYINRYYNISDSLTKGNIPAQDVKFGGTIKYHPLITQFEPGLKTFEEINLKGNFASADTDSALNFNISMPYIVYQNNSLRNGNINVGSKNERLNYTVNFDTLNYSTKTFYGTKINGAAANDSVSFNVRTQDKKQKDWFGLKAAVYSKDKVTSFRLSDSLLLNYEKWTVAPDNYIKTSAAGLIIHNFSIGSDTSKIFISSRQEVANSPIDISIDNFRLKSISSFISSDTLFATGIMDAKMEVTDLEKQLPAFTGNATISDLAIMQQPVGTISFTAQKQSENNINATLALSGNGNDITAKGDYFLNDEQRQFDITGDVKKLNIASLQGFTSGNLKNATGNLHGNFNASGKFADPRWKGELNFDTTKFTVAQLGTPFKIDNQKISFDYPAISLKDFIIKDSLNHQLKIDGTIAGNQAKTYDLNVDINTNDFILMNAPKAINNRFYGFASVDANISVTGNSLSPQIEGDIYVNEKSDVTIVIPERNYSKDEGKTVVRFIDRDTFDINPPVVPFTEEKEVTTGFAKYLNYNLNIEVNKNAKLGIIIDPVTGDEIQVQGTAQLNAGVDPGGNIILAGNYELSKGYYIFNYQFLQRKFDLVEGSSITFAGDPLTARLNVTAAYTVNTSSKDLIGNEVGTVDPVLANSFNQKIPFKVMLYITGAINKPIIKFDILSPETGIMSSELKTTIDNKLVQIRGDEAATNKQVFSLLLLSRFTGEQSSDFFKGNGNDFSDIARQSVSQFLSGALNEIAGNLLKGVDIDLNLNSYRDFNNGGNAQRTDLNVALSKSFLDDKLIVSIGKNFGVEGQDAATRGNDNFIPDVTVAYKLTKDGKYLLRAYRKNQFEVVMDGYVVETGLGFVVTMDYEKFRELFGKKK
jgi:translocation and assembly module TamB